MLKRFIIFLLAVYLLTLPCLAAEPESVPVLDEAEIEALLTPYVEKYSLNDENFGLAFYYTGTDESYLMNGDTAMYSASLYKVPLCMVLAEKVSSGELQQEDTFASMEISYILESCILRSSNNVAGAVYEALRPHVSELLTQYSKMSVEELTYNYQGRCYSPRFLMNTLLTLYQEPERFPNVIDNMLQAQPGEYFRQQLEGRYDVAQKYGQINGLLHNMGIIYTPTPIILVVMTTRVNDNLELMGELAEVFADYSLTLDERMAEQEATQLADESASQEQPEASEITEPVKEQLIEEEKQDQTVSEEPTQEEQVRLAEEAADKEFHSALKGLGIATAAFAALCLAFWLFRRFLF